MIKKNAVCSCGHCQYRTSMVFSDSPTDYSVRSSHFLAPLLGCKDLYFSFRKLIFADVSR